MTDKTSGYSRRKFLATSAAGLVSAGIAGLTPGLSLAQEASKKEMARKAEVIYRRLGKTDLKIPVISHGAGGCSDAGVVRAAYEKGVRLFETAGGYQLGANEILIGSVLKKMGVRDKSMLLTKIYTPAQRREFDSAQLKKKMTAELEGSLRRFKTDYVDMLFVHDVNSADIALNENMVEIMTGFRKAGKTRAIGLSTHANQTAVINSAIQSGVWDAVQPAFNFTMADDAELMTAIDNAGKNGIGIIAMKVMAGGSQWPNPESRRDYPSATVATALLKWPLNNKNVTTTVPAMNNYEQLEQDFSVAYDLEYTEDERKLLSDNNIKLSLGFCRQCSKCLATCPKDVDIPTLMRTYMYAAQYTDFQLARTTIDGIPANRGLRHCVSCNMCTARCANTVDIQHRIRELKAIYA